MNKFKKLPIDEIVKSYINGESLASLAHRFKVSLVTIKSRLIKSGIQTRSLSEAQCLPPNKGRKLTQEHKIKLSKSKMGKPCPKPIGFGEKISRALTGRKFTKEHKKNLSLNCWTRGIYGENHPGWKGGHSTFARALVQTSKYKEWRSAVFNRDNFLCQHCFNKKHTKINAHHIKKFLTIIREYGIVNIDMAEKCDELWDINNGITLCKVCHKIEEKNSK